MTAKVANLAIDIEAAEAPVRYTFSAGELEILMESEESGADARKEMHRREMIYYALLHILVGGYNEIANKGRCDSGFTQLSAVGAESMRAIARLAFSEEHGEVVCAALAGALRDGSKVPASMTLEDMTERPMREVCGLSTTRGPVIIHERQYSEQVEPNVNAIVGNALKERLLLIRPDWVLKLCSPNEDFLRWKNGTR